MIGFPVPAQVRSIGGPKGLDNPNPWNPLTQFGPVSVAGTVVKSGAANVLKFTGTNALIVASELSPPKPGEPGALVTGPGIPPGVTIGSVPIPPPNTPNPVVLVPVVGFTLTLGQSATYTFFSPVVGRATVETAVPTNNVIKINLVEPGPRGVMVPDFGAVALARTLFKLLNPGPDGTPANAIQVTGPGIAAGMTVTVTNIKEDPTNSFVTIQLSQPLVLGKQKPGTYAYTFGFQPPLAV